jgi:hypothetical protein
MYCSMGPLCTKQHDEVCTLTAQVYTSPAWNASAILERSVCTGIKFGYGGCLLRQDRVGTSIYIIACSLCTQIRNSNLCLIEYCTFTNTPVKEVITHVGRCQAVSNNSIVIPDKGDASCLCRRAQQKCRTESHETATERSTEAVSGSSIHPPLCGFMNITMH